MAAALGSVCDFDLPSRGEAGREPEPPGPVAPLLDRARRLAFPRPSARRPAALALEAPLEAEAQAAPLPELGLAELVLEQTAAADVFIERRLAAYPAEAAGPWSHPEAGPVPSLPTLFVLAARHGTARAVRAFLAAGAQASAPDPEAPLCAALARLDPQALETIELLAGAAPRVGPRAFRAGLAGLGLGPAALAGRPFPVDLGPQAGRLGLLLRAPAFGAPAAAEVLAALGPGELAFGLRAVLRARAAAP